MPYLLFLKKQQNLKCRLLQIIGGGFITFLTFPSAQVEVAISITKLSPSFAGAAKHRGLVPKIG